MMKRLLIGVKSYSNSGGRRSNEFYDDGSRVIMIVEERLMNDTRGDGSRAIGTVAEGTIMTFTTTT